MSDDPRIRAALAEIELARHHNESIRSAVARGETLMAEFDGWRTGYRYIQNIRAHLAGTTWESKAGEE